MIKPILFNTAMVQAILEGRKTTTRRIVKNNTGWHPPINYKYVHFRNELNGDKDHLWCGFADKGCFDNPCYCKAPYMLGDILYVRETWFEGDIIDSNEDIVERNIVLYRTDDLEKYDIEEIKWRPSIHMPKRLARIWLKVTDIRVEKLQDISEDEAMAEGAEPMWSYQPFKTKKRRTT